MASTSLHPLTAHGRLACRIVRGSKGSKTMHVFSVGMNEDWARWSSWRMDKSSPNEEEGNQDWHHSPITIASSSSASPSALSPQIALPTITSNHFSKTPLEEIGFCSVGAQDGEVYHVFRFVHSASTLRHPL
jgi:hypothetical protein